MREDILAVSPYKFNLPPVRFILTYLLSMLLFGCQAGYRTVFLNVPPQLTDRFTALTDVYPLPPGFRYQTDPTSPAALEIKLEIERWDMPSGQSNPAALRKILQRTLYAPATELWRDRESVSASANQSLSEVALLPLTEIDLPLKALAWEGLYPGDPDYPLVEQICISSCVPRGGPLPRPLALWVDSLPGAPPEPALTWIGAVGDIMPGEEAEELFLGPGTEAVFTDTLPILRRADLMLGNLEATATKHEVKTPKSFNYRFTPSILDQLQEAGFDYLSFANNHCYDYGETGFTDTLAHLRARQIPTSGVGLTPLEAATPWRTLIQDQAVMVLAAGDFPVEWNGFDGLTQAVVTDQRAGMLWMDEAGFAALKAACSPATFDIIYIHGGRERTLTPTAEQQATYRRCIDAGADLVIGSHPHALQGLEVYHNRLIAYSLGNFIFPDEVNYRFARVSAILQLGIRAGRIQYLKIHSVDMQGAVAALDPQEAGKLRLLTLTHDLLSAPPAPENPAIPDPNKPITGDEKT